MTNLERIRKKRGLSRKELENASGISRNVIRNYEQGVRDVNGMRLSTAYRISQILHCNPSDLLEGKQEIDNTLF